MSNKCYQKRATIIIPTYNERENISELLETILSIDSSAQIIIVDDNSPDGTGDVVSELAYRYPTVSCIHRSGKLGYASAIIEGVQKALADGADPIIHMDCDFSHPPCVLPKFLAKIDSCDLVIGSRYVKGGGMINCSFPRILLSTWANRIARIMLNLDIYDCTSGFRCYRNKVLSQINFDLIKVEGYSFLLELTYICYHSGYKILEEPIQFENRAKGKSKISKAIITEAAFLIIKLLFKKCFSSGSKNYLMGK